MERGPCHVPAWTLPPGRHSAQPHARHDAHRAHGGGRHRVHSGLNRRALVRVVHEKIAPRGHRVHADGHRAARTAVPHRRARLRARHRYPRHDRSGGRLRLLHHPDLPDGGPLCRPGRHSADFRDHRHPDCRIAAGGGLHADPRQHRRQDTDERLVTGINRANVPTNTTRGAPPRNAGPARRSARGFTMTELVVTVALAAILATIAAPSFNGMIATQRARTFAADLYVTLAKTRSAALTRNQNVTLQANAGGWQNGWQMLDANNNVLDNHAAATGVTVTPTATVTYRASGRLPAGAVAPLFVISTTSGATVRSEEHTSELQSQSNLVCRLLLEKKKTQKPAQTMTIHRPHA